MKYLWFQLSFQRKNGKVVYKCQICPKTGSTQAELKEHISAVHEGKKNYSCESCKMQFGFLSNKRKHQKLEQCPGKLVKSTNGYDEFVVRSLN